MPFYDWLRPDAQEKPLELQMKQRAAQKIKDLRAALDAHIAAADRPDDTLRPAETSRFIRIATWNLREFDSPSYGYRNEEAKAYIAEILSRFDLVALQEVRRDLRAFEDVKRLLGPSWDYIATDVTEGTSGNKERMVYLFNRNKVRFRRVAGELTLPDGKEVTDPFGDRFKVEGGAKFELPGGQKLVSPRGLKTGRLSSGQTKVEEDIEIPIPIGTQIMLPPAPRFVSRKMRACRLQTRAGSILKGAKLQRFQKLRRSCYPRTLLQVVHSSSRERHSSLPFRQDG